jgi:hypothetical protein
MTGPSAPQSNGAGGPRRPAQRNRSWLWFFGTLAVLGTAWIAGLVIFNRQQQLTPERLAEAQALWNDKGPSDYDMDYTQKGVDAGEFQVRVRDRQAVSVSRNGQALEERLYPYYTMPALFGYMEDFLKQDREPGAQRTYTVAYFDPEDGHMTRYVRRVMGGREQVELTVTLRKVP